MTARFPRLPSCFYLFVGVSASNELDKLKSERRAKRFVLVSARQLGTRIFLLKIQGKLYWNRALQPITFAGKYQRKWRRGIRVVRSCEKSPFSGVSCSHIVLTRIVTLPCIHSVKDGCSSLRWFRSR